MWINNFGFLLRELKRRYNGNISGYRKGQGRLFQLKLFLSSLFHLFLISEQYCSCIYLVPSISYTSILIIKNTGTVNYQKGITDWNKKSDFNNGLIFMVIINVSMWRIPSNSHHYKLCQLLLDAVLFHVIHRKGISRVSVYSI